MAGRVNQFGTQRECISETAQTPNQQITNNEIAKETVGAVTCISKLMHRIIWKMVKKYVKEAEYPQKWRNAISKNPHN